MLPYWKKVFDAAKVFNDGDLLGLGNADASERDCEYYHTMYCLVEDEIQKVMCLSMCFSINFVHF